MPLKVKIVRRKKKTTVARARRNTLNRPVAPNGDAPIRPGYVEKKIPNQKSNRSLEGSSNTQSQFSVNDLDGSMGSIPENTRMYRPKPTSRAPRPPPKHKRRKSKNQLSVKKQLSIISTDENGMENPSPMSSNNPSPMSVPNKRTSIMSNESFGSPTPPDEAKLSSKKKSLFRSGTDTKWEDDEVDNLHDEMQAQLDLLKKRDTQSSLQSTPRSFLGEEDYSLYIGCE